MYSLWHFLFAFNCLIIFLAVGIAVRAQAPAESFQDEVSFSNDIRPIVDNFCATCHAGDAPEGDLRLEDYESVRKGIENGDLLERINDHENPMPQDGLLPIYQRRMFQVWADSGFKNIGSQRASTNKQPVSEFNPPIIVPVDINDKGFGLLEKMQGHWIGSMNLMGQDIDWFAFDYRAISPSHVHGIFEGGTIGNLFTSFFVSNFQGKRTIMARNGGMLNGIYRTSYFVLDKAEENRGKSYYRLVDAYGGKQVMWMELTFSNDNLEFKSYTSRFGMFSPPRLHMAFKGKRTQPELAQAAAKVVGFPKNIIEKDFAEGLPSPNWPEEYPQTSASYIWQGKGKSIVELGKIARDPYRIDQMPFVSELAVKVQRTPATKDKKLQIFLSSSPLTDSNGKLKTEYGYLPESIGNSILSFPEIVPKESEFTFTYLHPGEYYITILCDMDGDSYPTAGDITSSSRKILIKPKSKSSVNIDGLRKND